MLLYSEEVHSKVLHLTCILNKILYQEKTVLLLDSDKSYTICSQLEYLSSISDEAEESMSCYIEPVDYSTCLATI